MPMLDVSIALTSPYLIDYFNVQRRQEVVNSFGRSILTIFQFNLVPGVVTPSGDNDLKMEKEGQTQGKSIQVATRFALRPASLDGAAVSWQPDLVVWNGDNYKVLRLHDDSNYGPGFTKASCQAMVPLPTPPQPQASLSSSAMSLINLPARGQLYSPTVVSSSLVTFPGSINLPSFLLYRNGILQTTQNNDYTVTVTGQTMNVTLAIPLGQGDFLIAFA